MAVKKTATFVAALVIALVVGAFGAVAFAAEDPYGGGKPNVKPTLIIDESNPEDDVLGERVGEGPADVQGGVQGAGSPLPFTGADLVAFTLIGASAVATGVYVVRRTRGTEAR